MRWITVFILAALTLVAPAAGKLGSTAGAHRLLLLSLTARITLQKNLSTNLIARHLQRTCQHL